jgi:putative SOS response-associated peptidase YedK
MCGRFARFSLSRELERFFNAHPPSFEIRPNYDVAQNQEIPVDISIGSSMINARMETVTSKSAFRAALKQWRCLIPPNGFYEWFGKAGNKQPYYFHLPSGKPLAFAGLRNLGGQGSIPGGWSLQVLHDHHHGSQ